MKSEKGITLIALVVTIIVLLILAGVTMSLVLGQEGIINKARVAAENTMNSQEVEQLQIAAMEAMTYNIIDEVDFGTQLTESIHKVYPDATITPSGDEYIISNMPSGNEYIIDGNGNVKLKEEEEPSTAKELIDMYLAGESCTEENCTNPDHLHIGDYVSYQAVVGNSTTSSKAKNGVSDQTFSVPSQDQEKIKWRVLGISGDRKYLLLTSDIVLTRAYNALGDYFYLYGEEELDNICSIYGTGQGAQRARSIDIEDINAACGVVQEGNGVYLKEDTERTNNIEMLKQLGQSCTIEPGMPTPESIVLGEKITESISVPCEQYGYGAFSLTVNDKIKDLIFKDITTGQDATYYIASNGIGIGDIGQICYGIGVVTTQATGRGALGNFVYLYEESEGNWVHGGTDSIANIVIRPVVELQPNVTTDTIQKIEG